MANEPFEIEIVVDDPDALRAWIVENAPGKVTSFTAHEMSNGTSYRCTIIGHDPKVAVGMKVTWHNNS